MTLVSSKVLGVVFTLGIVGFASYVLAQSAPTDGERLHYPAPMFAILAMAAYAGWLAFFESIWDKLMRMVSSSAASVSRYSSRRIFYRSMLARYVPGKILFVGVRTEGLFGAGVPRQETASAIVLEQIGVQSATIVIAIVISPLVVDALLDVAVRSVAWDVAAIVLTTICSAWFLVPDQMVRLLERVGSVMFREKLAALLKRLSTVTKREWRDLNIRYLVLVLGQALLVIPFAWPLVAESTATFSVGEWVLITCAYPVARLIGQLGLATPAGIGVREAAYVVLVGATISTTTAMSIAIGLRVVSIVVELIMFFSCYISNLQHSAPGR